MNSLNIERIDNVENIDYSSHSVFYIERYKK